MITKETDITPHPSLISKLGATGYRTYEALAELIDNSIDARLESEILKVVIKLDFNDGIITVTDNGKGMNFDTLRNAMILANENKGNKKRLGFYGLSLKTACSSLGEKFTIETSMSNEKKRYICSYDEKEWIKSDKEIWSKFPISSEDSNNLEHGTTIKIERLKVKIYRSLITKLSRTLGNRYGPFLKSKQLELYINTIKCEEIKPELVDGTKKIFNLKLSSGTVVTGWGALLNVRQGNDYGFSLFKNNRPIKMYDKSLLGRMGHAQISRIIGELNLDTFPTVYNKTDFIRESNEFRELETEFPGYKEFLDLKGEAIKPKYTTDITQNTKDKIKNITASFVRNADLIEKGKYDFPDEFKTGETQKFIDMELNVNETKIKLLVKLVYLSNFSLKSVKIGKNIEIDINQNSFAFRYIKDKTIFINSQIAEVISYYIANQRKMSFEDFFKLYDKFLNASVLEVKRKRPQIIGGEHKKDLKEENEKLLITELKEVNKYLKTLFDNDIYYFTATSVLENYLTQVPTTNYYIIYCEPGFGESIQNKLVDKFKDKFLILLSPKRLDLDYMNNIFKNTEITKVIVLKEKERESVYKKDGSVASLEVALVDIIFEVVKNGLPIPLDDVEELIVEFDSSEEIKRQKIKRYANTRGYEVKQIVEQQLAIE